MENKKRLNVLILIVLLLLYMQGSGLGETLTIPGTGDSQKILRVLAKAFEKEHPEIHVVVPASTGSGGGINAVLKGKSELGRVARPLTEKELSRDLHSLLFARSPVVFVVHHSVTGIDNLTSAQIVAIFSGQLNNWQQLGGMEKKLYVVNREHGDSSRVILEQKMTGFKAITQMAGKVFYTTPKAKEALIKHPDTIGYLPLAIVKGEKLNILGVNHVAPTTENIATGKYPFSVPLALVWQGTPTAPAQKFLHFLSSPAGRKIIEDYAVATL